MRQRAAELVTIFAGVVLALLADAAWDYGADRRREQDYLVGLRAELITSAAELARDAGVRTAGLDAVARTLAAARGEVVLPNDSVPHAMVALLNYRFFTPTRAVLDDLIDSGNLRLIRSDSLRFMLQRYRRQLDQLAVVEERERDFIAEVIEPYVAGAVRMDDLLSLRSYDDPVELPLSDAAGFRSMLLADSFASLAFMRWERSRTAHNFGRSVDFTIARLIEALDAQLETSPDSQVSGRSAGRD